MSIQFDQKTNIFKLDTDVSTYAFMAYEQGYLVHLYYGPKVPDEDLSHLMYRGWYDSLSPRNPKVRDRRFSLDSIPQELPGNSTGDFRISAIEAQATAGDCVTDLRYMGHRIYPGKPELYAVEGFKLPAAFAGEDEAETLEIEMLDKVTGLKAYLSYTVFAKNGAMARSMRVENTGGSAVQLRRAYSMCLELPSMDYDMVHMYGRWAKENTVTRHPLMHGIQSIRSKRGMTGPNHNPFMALLRKGADEDQGEAIGVSIVYSGNFSIETEVDTLGCPRVLAGIDPGSFSWHLEPGEIFQTPEVLTVFSTEGLGGMSRSLHRLFMNHLMRSQWTHKKRPLLINSWEAAVFDFDDNLLVDFAREAKKLGVDMLVMDDGWFGTRNDDTQALGDWQVNENKLKGGIKSLIERVNAEGLSFGIWYEPEMVNPNSDLYRAHPDWIIKAQGREDQWVELQSDPDAEYDEVITIDLSTLEPLAACPHSPDAVKPVAELSGMKIDQCCIGSCTNSSYLDMMRVAAILKGRTVHPEVSLTIGCGSKQVYQMLAQNGALADMISAGARILECACGPCIGMGQSPNSAGVSLRTFNRNFEGRSGTADAQVYLVSPETAAASAIAGVFTDPRTLGDYVKIDLPEQFLINDNLILPPIEEPLMETVDVVRGPNIKPLTIAGPLSDSVTGKAVLKVGDNITTDHIMPAGAKILPYRSNVPYLSQFCFAVCDKEFPERCKAEGGGMVIAGHNYGQGSSREHAALVPLYLGVKAVIAKSYARIHAANLANTGILPLQFADEDDYDRISQMDSLSLPDIKSELLSGNDVTLTDETTGQSFKLKAVLTPRQRDMVLVGGLLNYTKGENK